MSWWSATDTSSPSRLILYPVGVIAPEVSFSLSANLFFALRVAIAKPVRTHVRNHRAETYEVRVCFIVRTRPTKPIQQRHPIEKLQNERKALCIGEYALGQTSLEQIFNGFASQQEEELGQAVGTTYSIQPNEDQTENTHTVYRYW